MACSQRFSTFPPIFRGREQIAIHAKKLPGFFHPENSIDVSTLV